SMRAKRDPRIRRFFAALAVAGVTCMPALGWTDFCGEVSCQKRYSDWSCQCDTTAPNGMCVTHPSVGLLQPSQQCPSGSVKAQWPTVLGPNGEWQETFAVCQTCATGYSPKEIPSTVVTVVPGTPHGYLCCPSGETVICAGTTPRTCSCH
ncbi:MAG: hypothetical protein ACOYKZ_06000, partial [Chlamydiia bacterium]